MARIEEMRKEFAEVAEFVYIYIKEAHPEDEWQMESNAEDEVVYTQPTTMGERLEVANAFVADVSTPQDRAANFGKLAAATNLGAVLGPALAGVLVGTAMGPVPRCS